MSGGTCGYYAVSGKTSEEAERALHVLLADMAFEQTPVEVHEALVEYAQRFGLPIMRRRRDPWDAPIVHGKLYRWDGSTSS